MNIVPFPVTLEMLNETGKPSVRTPGVHLSDVIRYIENTSRKPGQREEFMMMSDKRKAEMAAYVEAGFTWERALETCFKSRMLGRRKKHVLKQREVEHDDILMNPDGVNIKGWQPIVEEYKWTSRSMARMDGEGDGALGDGGSFWSWGVQTMGYCHAYGTKRMRLFVYWSCGNYRPPVPCVMRYDVTFTTRELIENWRMIRANVKGYKRSLKKRLVA